MKIIKKIYHWCTKTRLRKILSSILALLMLLTSIKYIFLMPSTAKAADVYLGLNEGYGTSNAVHDSNNTVAAGSITNAVWKPEELCKTGKCLYFDGTGDYVSFADDANLDMAAGDNVTVEFWFRTSASKAMALISKYITDSSGYDIEMDSSGVLHANILDASNFNIYGVSTYNTYNDNIWHHVALVKTGTTSLELFLDGISQGLLSITSTDASNANNFYIGRYESDSSFDFSGFIDEVKILRSARTVSEVQADFNAETLSRGASAKFEPDMSFLSNGLVGYWTMDEGSGTSTSDLSGNTDTASFGAGGNAPSWSAGKFGNGITFSGGQYISTTNTLAGNTNFSISAWAMPTASISNYTIIAAIAGYHMGIVGYNGKICAMHWSDASPITVCESTFNQNEWHHYSVTFDANNKLLTLYKDGQFVGNSTVSDPRSNNTFFIGGLNSAGYYFTGVIDNVRKYNRPLSADDALKLYKWAPGPKGYWRFDENSGTTIYDLSGNGVNGTAYNGATYATGKFGSAGSFDGTDDVIELGNNKSSLNIGSTKSMTAGAWIYRKDNSNDSEIFTHKTGYDSNQIGWELYNFSSGNGGNMCAYVSDGTDSSEACTSDHIAETLNTWEYWSFTFDRTTKVTKVYKSGTDLTNYSNIPSGAVDSTDLNNLCVRIGARPIVGVGCAGSASTSYHNGYIDEVIMYDYVRSPAQMVEDMNAGHPAPGSPVGSALGSWRFDEGADNTCSNGTNDACNSGSAGTVLDGAQSNMAVPATSTSGWTNIAKYNKGLNFDGSNDVVNFGSNAAVDDLPASGLSISAWIYPTSMGESSQGVILAKNSGATPSSGWLLQFAGTNALKFSVDGSTDLVRQTSNSAVTLNAWNNIVLTWDGVITTASSVHIFINGLETTYATTTNGASRVSDASSSLYAGNDSSGASTFAGTIDEIKLFNFALTSDQALVLNNQSSTTVMGAVSTDTSGNASWSAQRGFCPPGNSDTNCASGDPSPIIDLPFDENTGTTAKDISVNGLTPTTNGNTGWKPGKFGASYFFDGTSDYLTYLQSTLFDFGTSTPFTVQGWFKLSENSADQDLVLRSAADTDKAGFVVWLNNAGNIYANVRTATPSVLNCRIDGSITGLEDDSWHFITAVYNRNASCTTNDIFIYIDGKRDTATSVGVSSGNTNQDISVTGVQVSSNSNSIKGQADEVRIYNYARSPAQIAWDYNNGKALGWWKFDENTGTPSTLNDSSGNGLNGAAAGTLSSANWVTGKYNSALSFNGSDNKITVTDTSALDITGDFTISAWINKTADANAYVLSKTNEGTSGGYALLTGTSGEVYCRTNSGVSNTDSLTLTGLVSANTGWHHVVAVRSGTSCRVYVDGVDRTNTANTHTTVTANALNLTIGARPDTTQLLTGNIDDVRLYNFALSKQQIQTVRNESASVRYGP